jgi:hypothetical protein
MIIKRTLYAAALGLAIALAIVLIRSHSVRFTVKNVDGKPLRAVVVHVTGRSYPIGDLEPGAIKTVELSPTGESDIDLSSAGNPRLKVDCYFEPGYGGRISAEVTAIDVVAVQVALDPAPLF